MGSKEKSYKKTMVIAIAIAVIAIFGSISYAFYQTTINGKINGTIAEWKFTANDQTNSFNINLGELYPGKTGTYNITLSAIGSELDVYYEIIFTTASINQYMYWDSGYTKKLSSSGNSYVGKYGVITKGSSVTVPIYFNWPYGVEETYNPNLTIPEIKIIARQYTGYSGSIPMKLQTYFSSPSYETINSTSGYIITKN